LHITASEVTITKSTGDACAGRISNRQVYFVFFIASGLCSILYEIVWVRITMAKFSVTTAIISIALSAFMLGLGIGSWGAGTICQKLARRPQFAALRFYALLELLIGVSSFAVPYELSVGRELLLKHSPQLSTPAHYIVSGFLIAISLIPWCACMGATFPFAMAAVKEDGDGGAEKSFSYLYLANILGATAGCTLPLLLVEALGFARTLLVGACMNLLLAASAFLLSFRQTGRFERDVEAESRLRLPAVKWCSLRHSTLLWILLVTGLSSMGAELTWIRLYTPFLGTTVYAFATILGMYLVAMYVGTWLYRKFPRMHLLESELLWIALAGSILLAFVTADPRISITGILRVALGIMPFSGLVGMITPAAIDAYSGGDAKRAGSAYAINVVGCVLGPLLSGFLLLPYLGERVAVFSLALPWLILALKHSLIRLRFHGAVGAPSTLACVLLTITAILPFLFAEGSEQQYDHRQLKRDTTATVIAAGSTHDDKRLLVNGIGMTSLSPNTKVMVHLPMALLPRKPENGLVICFGMGTTHLAMLSWGVRDTAVELVPSVPTLVTFFHPNASASLRSSLSRIVIDDGRSYLERSSEKYDVITIDPPPPVSAAGSSLLYSKEFYAVAKQHLRADGILQQWLFEEDPALLSSVARALAESFPYVRAFRSLDDFGVHFLASMKPIPKLSASELAAKLPQAAAQDLVEWGPASNPKQQFELVLQREVSITALTQRERSLPALQDDRPTNEYFVLRRLSPFWHSTVSGFMILNVIGFIIFMALRLAVRNKSVSHT
jgi:predicted membrane-bound spermidine synthase